MAEERIGFVGHRGLRPSAAAGGVNGRVPGPPHPIKIMGASRTEKQFSIINCFYWVNLRQSGRTARTEASMDDGGYNRLSLCNYFVKGNDKVTRMPDLKERIMEALGDSNIYMIGLCGKDDDHMCNLFDTISRRVTRDDLFGMIVMVSIRDKPDSRRIQQEIAHELGFSYREQETPSGCIFPSRKDENAIIENAKQLSERIQTQPKILFILRDLHTRLDLAKLGIPFGVDHNGCKLILTSQSKEILSDQDQMNVQHIYRV